MNNGAMNEPYGTTPLPVASSGSPVHVSIDLEALYGATNSSNSNKVGLQVPQVAQIAGFDAVQLPGQSIDANRHFLLYAVKNGLVRVLHKSGAPIKHLLRGHSGQVLKDIKFFQDGDILGTVGTNNNNNNSRLLVWRVLERSPEIKADILLELSTHQFEMTGMVWHPFNPNLFFMLHKDEQHRNVATLVETTRIETVTSTATATAPSHALGVFHGRHVIMDGAIRIAFDQEDLTDLCWSDQDTNRVLTTFATHIVLWDLQTKQDRKPDGTVSPSMLAIIDTARVPQLANGVSGTLLSRCFFVPYDDSVSRKTSASQANASCGGCFVTGWDSNSKLAMWGPMRPGAGAGASSSGADLIQIVELESGDGSTGSSGQYLVDGCFAPSGPGASPPPGYLIVADTRNPRLLALHCQSAWSSTHQDPSSSQPVPLLAGCDYVVPFANKEPIYSMKVVSVSSLDISDENGLGTNDNDDDDGANGAAGAENSGGVTFDIKVYAYQSKNTQCLTLTSYMCLPPEHTYVDPTPGIQVRRLYDAPSAHVSDVGDLDDEDDDQDLRSTELKFDEEYDVEAEDDDVAAAVDEDDAALAGPEPSALPAPRGFLPSSNPAAAAEATPLASNPFANWLGAIAAKTTGSQIIPPPPVPPLPLPSQPVGPTKSDAMSEISTGSSTPPLLHQPQQPTRPPPPAMGSIPLAEDLEPPAPPSQPPVIQSFLSPLDILGLSITGALPAETKTSASVAAPLVQPPSSSAKSLPRQAKTPPKASSKAKAPKAATSAQPHAILPRSTPGTDLASTPQATVTLPAAAVSPSMHHPDEPSVRAVVREEVDKVLVPTLQKAVQLAVHKAVTPLQASVDRLLKMHEEDLSDAASRNQVPASVTVDPEVLMQAVEAPLKACVASHVKSVWIPAMESLTSQVLAQVSSHLDETRNVRSSASRHEMDAISTQLSTMTALVTKLTSEVQALRTTVAAQQVQQQSAAAAAAAVNAAAPPPPPASADDAAFNAARIQVASLLREAKYEAAFTKAVTTGTGDNSMAVFCCANASLQSVLGGPRPALSQPILLCLMQQLGTSLLNLAKADVTLELTWLQEIALSLNPRDAQIHPHVSGVLQQLVAGINTRMGANDPALQRPLQRLLQVVRGMQMG